MGVDMSNPPPSRTKDFFASPALSLSLAGIFRGANDTGAASEAASTDVEAWDEAGSGGGAARRAETVEMSSENSGLVRSRSEDDYGLEGEDEDEGEDNGDKSKKKKRKKYHRHTAEQIREMEALFKESPHPDEKQRQQLSKQLGLAPRQVKFWFQNRRTQIKAIQERHENSLLKSEMDKLRDENKSMREIINNSCCPNCGNATISKDSSITTEEQHLRIENARLKSEVEKLRAALEKYQPGSGSPGSSSADKERENRCSLDLYNGTFGLEKSRITEIVNKSVDELIKMATAGDPLWIRSVETGREILNYDEYVKEFPNDSASTTKRSIEVSRETGMAFVDLPKLVHSFMDVNQWKQMFPNIVSKAANVDVICNGEEPNRNGAVQLMFAELQLLTPMVPTREVYFVRGCRQLSTDQWAVVDVSIDKVEDNIDASLVKCRKRPSGCIFEDKSNGHCKVTWLEHWECNRSPIHTMFRNIVYNGIAFGAKHWIATLQQQCERLVFFMATNVPTKDSSGVTTLAGRKSILKLAERMTGSFSRVIGASSYNIWTKVASKTGEDTRVSSRRNLNDPGEPLGLIVCAASSVWLPVPAHTLFDFLRDETQRSQWDIMSNGGPAQSLANLAKGQDRGNSITIQAMKANENPVWILQDSCTNSYESMVVYAPVDITGMQSVMTGCDASNMAVLPSGFSILPDGIESRPLLITSRPEERSSEGGCLLTIAFQILTNPSSKAKVTAESVESVSTLISCTLKNIKASLHCEDN
uniref:Uncharacterized protein n=1 Tax=Kalanchoe fedtschenkoi TaxID=63787 RepID=A0A7N0REU8_KALFE